MQAPAWAGLGEPEDSVQADRTRMRAQRQLEVRSEYTIHDLRMDDGSRVRQFARPDGMVFAVTWNTLFKPDLAALLGTSFPAYSAAAGEAARRGGMTRHFRHETLDLVVHSNAHLNVFSGFAFRRSLLPPGLTVDRLRLE